jgi:putative nucleotidyltransferase with HDIG domain
MTSRRAAVFTGVVTVVSVASLFLLFLVFPPPYAQEWFLVFGTLLVLSLFSEFLAVSISEGGSIMTMDYVPQLGAIILLGPTGAAAVAATSWTIYQIFGSKKPAVKAVFNVAQLTLTVAIAGLVYVSLGGSTGLDTLRFTQSLLPFAASVLVYFGLNHVLVIAVISFAEQRPLDDILHQLIHTPPAFDLIISPLALLIGFLYVEWGVAALLATIIPLIGLRYSYDLTLQLRQLNSDLLRVLIKTIEAQDPYTSGHSIRVAEGAVEIAQEMGLGANERNNIETAALLHDIGKIDSDYRKILTQEESLSEDQLDLIKEHPERGVQLIESVRSLDPAVLRYIKHHHERYDGDGYPDGLQSGEIPLGARIIMVSDAIDAMVTSRAYRDALPKNKAESELIENKGKQFDPDVVDAALNIDLITKHLEATKKQDEL